MPSSLTWAMMWTQEPPSPGLVLEAWVTGPDVQGSSPLQQCREGGTLRCTVPLSPGPRPGHHPSPWPQAGAGEPRKGIKPIILKAHPQPMAGPGASPPICGNSETTHRQSIPNLLL